MDQIITNIVSLGLLVFLFAAILRRAPDDRLRCWIAGWICVLIHIALKLWTPDAAFWRIVSVCAGLDGLALAAIFFRVSTMIVRDGRKAGVHFGTALAFVTLLCLTVSLTHPSPTLLAVLVIGQQGVMVALAMHSRINRQAELAIVIPACLLSLTWMLYAIAHGQDEVVIVALLGEMFIVAGANFWFAGWSRSLGLVTTCTGLVVFGVMFAGVLATQQMWPKSSVATEVFGISSFCAAVGMILVVFEDDVRALRQMTTEHQLIFDTNPHPLWILDCETLEFMSVNESACAKHGYTREEFAKLRLPDLLEESMVPEAIKQISFERPNPNRASRHVRKDGTVMEMDITAHSIVFRGRPGRFVLGIDVSEREELQRQVLHHSLHDTLTGLPNRSLFEEQLQRAVTRAFESKEKVAVLCFNLDRFKRINDTYGTGVGDECLKRVAGIIVGNAGAMDVAARVGGDRFVLVLTGLRSGLPVEHVLSEVMEAFSEPVAVGETKVRLSISAGLALYPDDGDKIGPLWRSAESALARAREAGGGQVMWSNPELRVEAENQGELEAFMRSQLEAHGFYLAYQPIFAMDGRVESMEALLRLDHPVLGPISPARFIPVAEETGMIVPIGEWVIEEVCRQVSAWREERVRLVPIAVNVSGLQLARGGFAERLVGIMSRHRIDPGQIDLEITESTDMLNVKEVIRQMALLSEIGIRFSIDDFGTGHSTLSRLDKLPLRILKVDRTFIERLCAIEGTRSIVQATISMAKALDMRVVAEGVEFEEQLDVLMSMGCDYLQGFLLSRPIPPVAVPRILESSHPLLANAARYRKPAYN